MKSVILKRSKKSDREFRVLVGMVELYLKSGKPVGSNTLRENGFEELSSATIRNYFAKLEDKGFLTQQHSSGGRIPTSKAYKLYAELASEKIEHADIDEEWPNIETKEPAAFLNLVAEKLSRTTGYAVCISSPRFDHDFILDVKLVSIDKDRVLCVLVTDFGLIKTETLLTDVKLSAFSLKRIEGYFIWQLTGRPLPFPLEDNEEKIAKQFYEEVMIRYIVGYANFSKEDLYRTGFSHLLTYPEFNDPLALANGLELFENTREMHNLLSQAQAEKKLLFWIGDDLLKHSPNGSHCTFIAIPYRINHTIVGSLGLLGPTRMPYSEVFALMNEYANKMSETLTRSLYKFKLQYRQPSQSTTYLEQKEQNHLLQSSKHLLEDQSPEGAQDE
ncbi:MAG: heat-inducible transcriptional repressor HrcA [Parachlamydiales bacterium]|nr:heat-inducible transcriptional repressor HrcA [Parachlamydiales bacterium]